MPASNIHHLNELFQTIFERYSFDFRGYSGNSIRRRLKSAMDFFGIADLSILNQKIQSDEQAFLTLLQYLTVPTSEMFRDPSYFLAIRKHVIPILKTYPSIKIWIAGCSSGEEVYSFAILLREEGLEDRSLIYATDINPVSLEKAEQGIFPIDRVQLYSNNYLASGGQSSLSAYYSAHFNSIILDKSLRENVVFTDHSLATDSSFSEVQFVSCRNVLIYFGQDLQDRAVSLFLESLPHRGFLGLGAKESLRFSKFSQEFDCLCQDERIYRRNAIAQKRALYG